MMQCAAHQQPAVRQASGVTGVGVASSSMRLQDDQKRKQLAQEWAIMAEDLRAESDVLSEIPNKSGADLAFLLEDRAAATLSKHSCGWRKWLEFARASGFNLGEPSSATILDFCQALSMGAIADRGAQRTSKAKAVVQAMKLVGHKLGAQKLLSGVKSHLVLAWLAQDKWQPKASKEAVPLPLSVVAKLELEVQHCNEDDSWLLGCLLLCWSDAQRLQFSSLLLRDGSLRGWCWRTKVASHGMPFGALVAGVSGSNWGQRLLNCKAELPLRDFLVGSGGVPMTYTSMLAQMRRCLSTYASLTPAEAQHFTLHSCKLLL